MYAFYLFIMTVDAVTCCIRESATGHPLVIELLTVCCQLLFDFPSHVIETFGADLS